MNTHTHDHNTNKKHISKITAFCCLSNHCYCCQNWPKQQPQNKLLIGREGRIGRRKEITFVACGQKWALLCILCVVLLSTLFVFLFFILFIPCITTHSVDPYRTSCKKNMPKYKYKGQKNTVKPSSLSTSFCCFARSAYHTRTTSNIQSHMPTCSVHTVFDVFNSNVLQLSSSPAPASALSLTNKESNDKVNSFRAKITQNVLLHD